MVALIWLCSGLKAATAAFYKPFPGFHDFDDATEHAGAIKIDEMEQLLEFGQWQEACDKAYELIELSLEGLRYLQTWVLLLMHGLKKLLMTLKVMTVYFFMAL